MNKISLAIHGGAGNIQKEALSPEMEAQYKDALKTALDLGYKALEEGKTALEMAWSIVEVDEDGVELVDLLSKRSNCALLCPF